MNYPAASYGVSKAFYKEYANVARYGELTQNEIKLGLLRETVSAADEPVKTLPLSVGYHYTKKKNAGPVETFSFNRPGTLITPPPHAAQNVGTGKRIPPKIR